MKIYFIRHAEGYHNLSNEGYKIKFPKLTDKGIKQATDLSKKLEKIKIDTILVSPLRRTLHTAELAFGKRNFKVLEFIREYIGSNCDLRESKVELEEKFPYADFSSIEDFDGYNNLENDDDVEKRLQILYQWLFENKENKTMAIVSHGSFLNRFFHKYNQDLNIKDIDWLDNCGIKIIDI